MVKRAIFLAIFLILMINFVSSGNVHLISPLGGDNSLQLNQFCDVDWRCTNWGECIGGEKTRVCYDDNNCRFKYNVPVTKIKCKADVNVGYVSNLNTQLIFFGFFTGILLLILLIILVGLRR